MTLRHTRSLILPTIAIYDPECGDPGCFDCKVRRKWEYALVELALAEAVIEAARRLEPWHEAAEARWMSMEDATIPVRARRIAEACRAVAALDAARDSNAAVTDRESSDAAQKDGQTAGDGERVEAPAANDSLTPSKGEPVPAPAACPCDGTDCVC